MTISFPKQVLVETFEINVRAVISGTLEAVGVVEDKEHTNRVAKRMAKLIVDKIIETNAAEKSEGGGE